MPLGDILLARPDQLDRTAHLLGDERAFGGIVAERAPAEAAAHVALVEIHLLVLEAERLATALRDSSGAWLPSHTSALSPASLMRTTALSGSICA
jgi:hypothetical protein